MAAAIGHEAIVRLLNDRRDLRVRDLDIAPAGQSAGDVSGGGIVSSGPGVFHDAQDLGNCVKDSEA